MGFLSSTSATWLRKNRKIYTLPFGDKQSQKYSHSLMVFAHKKVWRTLVCFGGSHGSHQKNARSADLKQGTTARVRTAPHFMTSPLQRAQRLTSGSILLNK